MRGAERVEEEGRRRGGGGGTEAYHPSDMLADVSASTHYSIQIQPLSTYGCTSTEGS